MSNLNKHSVPPYRAYAIAKIRSIKNGTVVSESETWGVCDACGNNVVSFPNGGIFVADQIEAENIIKEAGFEPLEVFYDPKYLKPVNYERKL